MVSSVTTNIESITNKIERERKRLNKADKKVIDIELKAIFNWLCSTYRTIDNIVKHY